MEVMKTKRGQSNFIAGLDIGSSAVRMAVGQWAQSDESEDAELQILGAAETAAEGVSRGMINNIEDVVSSISACYERTERIVGAPLDNVWLGISGQHIIVQPSKGVVAVSKAESEISREDIGRAMEAARAISTPLNYEILHVVPKSFNVDGQQGVRDPVGMTGIRLEVDTQIILGLSSQIKNLTKAVYRAGLNIDGIVLAILAAAEAVVTPRQKELGVAVVNLGASTTGLAIYEEGNLLHNAILPIGAGNVTNDVAIGLRTSIEVAERVKVECGDCAGGAAVGRDEFDLYDYGAETHEIIKRRYLSEIINARMEEILCKVDQELRRVQRSGLLPAGVVFTGGGAKLTGMTELAKIVLRLPAALGPAFSDLKSATDKTNDLSFCTAVGLVKWGSNTDSGFRMFGGGRPGRVMGSAWGKLKKGIISLIP